MISLSAAEVELMISLEVLLIPGIVVLFLLMIYAVIHQHIPGPRHVDHQISINIDNCMSEDCVRCKKYKSVIERARRMYGNMNTGEMLSLTDRIKSSIEKLSEEPEFSDINEQQPNVLYLEGLEAEPWWDDYHFVSDVTLLENNYDAILAEFQKAYEELWPNGWLLNNTPSGEWAVFHIISQGKPNEKNKSVCPKTFELVNQMAHVMKENVFGNVSFSVVQPKTHISAHYGPTNARIRCHFGLHIPSCEDESYLTVRGVSKGWQEGRSIFFDDSFLHEVKHDNAEGEPRAVLLIDLWHPSLNEEEKVLIDRLFSPAADRPKQIIRNIPLPDGANLT